MRFLVLLLAFAAASVQAAPPGATALRVDGFRGMAGVENMLREIGRAASISDIDARADRFAADWRAAARCSPIPAPICCRDWNSCVSSCAKSRLEGLGAGGAAAIYYI